MPSFEPIRARAARRKGGDAVLASLLPAITAPELLAAVGDDRELAQMTKRIFCSGFAWTVIDKKWPGFEAAFLGFEPPRLLRQPPEFWDGLISDTQIVRNGQKIMSVEKNAAFVVGIAAEHGSFGRFLAAWPAADQVGLMELQAKRGARLGGNTGRYFLRFIGKDGFIPSRDLVLCLREAGLDIVEAPTSGKDLVAIRRQLNGRAEETGLPCTHISRICAMSIGENHTPEQLNAGMSE